MSDDLRVPGGGRLAHLTRWFDDGYMPAASPILVVMGVAGSGKSTVAAQLAGELGWDAQEGDDLHPLANRIKMAAGKPLDDADRRPWLERVAAWIDAKAAAGRPGIITCSALKRAYRDRLARPEVIFVHLAGSREQIAGQLAGRTDHFMPGSLLDSQLAALEPLQPDEPGITVEVSDPADRIAADIIRRLGLGSK